MGMFALAANQSVIQAVKGLRGEAKKIRLSIVLGIGLDAVWCWPSPPRARARSPSWPSWASPGVGSWAVWIGSLFTAWRWSPPTVQHPNLRDIVHEQQLHLGNSSAGCWPRFPHF